MAKRGVTTIMCANCGKFIGQITGKGVSGQAPGICKECVKLDRQVVIDNVAKTRGISTEEARKLVNKWIALNV